MPTWFVATGVAFGLLFFAFHAFWAVSGLRYARSRDDRLEAAGAVVPGLAGLLLAAAAVTSPALLSLGFAILSLPVLVLGRAVYELVVFRSRS